MTEKVHMYAIFSCFSCWMLICPMHLHAPCILTECVSPVFTAEFTRTQATDSLTQLRLETTLHVHIFRCDDHKLYNALQMMMGQLRMSLPAQKMNKPYQILVYISLYV